MPLRMSDAAIRIENLCKTYAGGKRALNDVSLDIPRGQIFGLLGPNGAGKSTMINILAGLVMKTSGAVSIWGFDIDERPRNAKRAIGTPALGRGQGPARFGQHLVEQRRQFVQLDLVFERRRHIGADAGGASAADRAACAFRQPPRQAHGDLFREVHTASMTPPA